jgi:hypothetical protein
MVEVHSVIYPIFALIAGILILIFSAILNYVVAIYLIIIGILGILRGCLQKFSGLGYVKASGLNDCKASCIELIQRALQ